MALLSETFINKHEHVLEAEAKQALASGVWGDSAALKLVVQDCNRAENFQTTKEWVMNWMTASTL